MTDNRAPGGADTRQAGGRQSGGTAYDLSMDGVPSQWMQAQADSPLAGNDVRNLRRDPDLAVIPRPHDGPFVAVMVALAAAFVGGAAWYTTAAMEIYAGPWTAVALGALIALTVRVTSRTAPSHKIVVSLLSYLLVTMAVLLVLTHRDLIALYGSIDGPGAYEEALIRTRLQDVANLAAYGLGAVVATVVPVAGHH